MITEVIEDEVRAGNYDPPVEPATLGYAIVRLAEAFIFSTRAPPGCATASIACATSRPRCSASTHPTDTEMP